MSNKSYNFKSVQGNAGSTNNSSWPRETFYPILTTALFVKEYRFARQAALSWLVSFPGDLPVRLIHGQALLAEGHTQQAHSVAESLCARDPEFLAAQLLLVQTLERMEENKESEPKIAKQKNIAQYSIQALGGKSGVPRENEKNPLKYARQALNAKDLPLAEVHIQKALANEPDSQLVALTHLRIIASQPDTPRTALQTLAQHFHNRWPDCVQFILMLADSIVDSGEADAAVALLHQAAAYDVTGQVVSRLWGPDHQYVDIWPTQLSAVTNSPIPAPVAAALGWNLLEPSEAWKVENDQTTKTERKSEINTPEPQTHGGELPQNDYRLKIEKQPDQFQDESQEHPEILRSVKAELERIGDRLQQPVLAQSDGRFPTYIIISSRSKLQGKYGRAGFAMLDAAMQELADVIRRRQDWGATIFYVDDPTSAAEMGIKPVQSDDAWSIKLAIADFDQALEKNGAMIGALLIVGGPDIIPFHGLPNPTDDPDMDVPSDNPYSTRDENYFIPEWPVGRLPDEVGKNPALLLGNLQSITDFHTNFISQSLNWWEILKAWFTRLFSAKRKNGTGSFGYSAEIWRKASVEVYQQIGSPRELVTSPPIDVSGKRNQSDPGMKGKLGYFNLHGLADTGEWYGQRDPSNGSSGPDYPVAFRTHDVLNGSNNPEIIFSEACYGANIIEKTIKDSLALKFLASGCRAIVGSTVMSYGSISTPLNAADLLGISFWENIKEGLPAGDSLRRAKIHLAREMHNRQGYLDGEDQKTLISFVLYGDPLALANDSQSSFKNFGGKKRGKTLMRPINPPENCKTVCDRTDNPGVSDPIPEEVMTHIKRVVTQYLPGMQGADITMSHEHMDCECEGHDCPTRQLGSKTHPDIDPERRVVTLSKSIPSQEHTHPAYARLTLDKTGKVVKVAVSR